MAFALMVEGVVKIEGENRPMIFMIDGYLVHDHECVELTNGLTWMPSQRSADPRVPGQDFFQRPVTDHGWVDDTYV